MPFYDHFVALPPTGLGRRWMERENQKYLTLITDAATDSSSLLEVGPGLGVFAKLCRDAKLGYVGVEGGPAVAEGLRQQGFRIIEGLAPPIPAPSEAHDITYASHVLEHMPDFRQALLFVEEMMRVTAPGGLVCLRVPDAMACGWHFWNVDYSHNFVTTKRRVCQMYQDAGLQVIRVTFFSGHNTGLMGWLTGWLARLFPYRLIEFLLPAGSLPERLYRAKLTFLPGFLIIGRKPEGETSDG